MAPADPRNPELKANKLHGSSQQKFLRETRSMDLRAPYLLTLDAQQVKKLSYSF